MAVEDGADAMEIVVRRVARAQPWAWVRCRARSCWGWCAGYAWTLAAILGLFDMWIVCCVRWYAAGCTRRSRRRSRSFGACCYIVERDGDPRRLSSRCGCVGRSARAFACFGRCTSLYMYPERVKVPQGASYKRVKAPKTSLASKNRSEYPMCVFAAVPPASEAARTSSASASI